MLRKILRLVTERAICHSVLFKATIIDENDNPEIGKLVEVTLPWVQGRHKFLRVRCGTKRGFAIGVPPDTMTALDAQAWITGLDPKDFRCPEIRT